MVIAKQTEYINIGVFFCEDTRRGLFSMRIINENDLQNCKFHDVN